MAKHESKTFSDQTVSLDGNSYIGCTFRNCRFTYSGGAAPVIGNCDFDSFELIFEGAAKNTADFMHGLASDPGTRDVIRNTFPSIFGH